VRLGKREFRPGLWPTLAMLLLCALFLRLGWWQWGRAEYKRNLLTEYAAQIVRPPLRLAQVGAAALAGLPPNRRVQIQGRYDGEHQLLLEDMIRDGVVGYEVLTPFQTADGSELLVDRGWVAVDARSGRPPAVEVADVPRRITAALGKLPVAGLRLGRPAAPSAAWPKIMFYPQAAELAAVYGPKLLPHVLLLDPAEPDGYRRETQLDVGFPPERHLAYAFQWLALAVAVFIVWLWVNLRPSRKEAEHEV